jgi:hypothetical protein
MDGNYIKLIKKQRANKKINQYFSEVYPGMLYRSTCVYALWKRETLLRLLVPGENAWQFEINGSKRSDEYHGFYVVNKSIFRLIHLVVKGKLLRHQFRKIKRLGYQQTILRGVFGVRENLWYVFKFNFRGIIWSFIPYKYHRIAYNKLKN